MKRRPQPPGASAPDSARRTALLAGAGLVLAALAVYANSFSGPFLFDDLLSIPQNPTLRHLATALFPPGGGLTVTGRPVLNLSFALNRALGGENVWGYHAVNLLIHTLAGLTLFGLVRRTLVKMNAGNARPPAPTVRFPGNEATFTAFAVALLWIVHPLQTESVTYLVQRAESLMGLFYLLTLYAFIRGAEPGGSLRWFVLSFVACLLGMGTKEVMVSAPVIVLLYDRTFLAGSFQAAWQQRGRIHLALAATWIPLAALVLFGANRGGTAGFGTGVGFGAYAATQFEAVTHYLWLTFWPHPLIIDYGVRWTSSAAEVAPYAVLVTALGAGTVVALVRRPALGFLGVFFFAILAPTSLIPGTRQTLAEHRMYLALAPGLVLLVLALHTWLGRRAWLAAAVAAVACGALTLQRNTVYRSSAAIWRNAVEQRPDNAAARNNYGNILSLEGHPLDALVQYREAIQIEPRYAEAYHNAGNALAKLGRLPEAIADYEEALRLNPKMPDAQTALGNTLEDAGRGDEALAHYGQALKIDPNYTDAHNSLGLALARSGRFPEAIAHYERALQTNPARPDLHNNLGNALRQTERIPEAIAHYEQALKLRPDVPEVKNNLGIALLLADRTPEAIVQFQEALQLDPNLGQVHLNLALALESVGRTAEAAPHYAAAQRLGASLPRLGN